MRETKYWTWHMAAGMVILFLLGLHMLIMHLGGTTHLFAPRGGEAVSKANSLFRDGKLFFTVTYVLLLGVALYHGLYGLRTIFLELTLKPAVARSSEAWMPLIPPPTTQTSPKLRFSTIHLKSPRR